jgi:hypothetical protein
MDSTLNSILSDEGPAEVEAVEAVEAEAVEQVEQPTGETTAPPAEPPKTEDKQSQGLVAAAIAERNRRQEAEKQAAHYRELYEQSQRQRPAGGQGEPDPNQYTDQAQYFNDLVEYRANARVEKERQTWQQQMQREQMEREINARTESVVKEGQTKYQDFDAAIEALRPVLHDDFRKALVLRGGPDVAYHLSKDLAEAYRVASLPQGEMLLEIAELRGMLRAKPVAPPPVRAPIPQTLTQARDARGQFQAAVSEMTPLDAVLNRT